MLRNKFGDKVDPELVEAVRREIMADMQQYRELTEDNPGRGRSLFSTGRTFNNRHRSMGVLRREVRRELQAIQHIEQRLGRVKNPRVRKMVYEILEEAGDLGLGVDDVLSSFPRGGGGLGDLMGLGRDRSLPWIIGAALLGLALYPNARENIKKMVGMVTEEAAEISEKMQTMAVRTKEEVEDMVAEAQFKRMQDSMLKDGGGPNNG